MTWLPIFAELRAEATHRKIQQLVPNIAPRNQETTNSQKTKSSQDNGLNTSSHTLEYWIFGSLLGPSSAGTYDVGPVSCRHINMSHGRGTRSLFWITCLDCGTRWRRVPYGTVDEIPNHPKAKVPTYPPPQVNVPGYSQSHHRGGRETTVGEQQSGPANYKKRNEEQTNKAGNRPLDFGKSASCNNVEPRMYYPQ